MQRIGFDFDNTIASYEKAIRQLSKTYFGIHDDSLTKVSLKNLLLSKDREKDWTLFQGQLYGPGMKFASPTYGFKQVAYELKMSGHDLFIVSHRTKMPYLGEKHDLHKHAKDWINVNLTYNELPLFEASNIFFCETKEEKIRRIEKLCCSIFIDDLEDILLHKLFPKNTKKILFSPSPKKPSGLPTIKEWKNLTAFLD